MGKFDYLIVGSGLYGSIFAREATNKGYKCLVISRKNERYIIVLGYVVIAVAFLVKIVMNPDQHYYPYYFMWQ